MQKGKVADGANPDGTVNDETVYIPESWNDNLFNLFNVLLNNGYTLIDDDLEQLTKVFKGKYVASYTYNTSGVATQTVNDVVEGSDGLLYEVQSNAVTGDDPVGSVTGDWKTYKPEYLARIEKAITHDMGSDADYTLTTDQNTYGKLIITDTNPFLSTGRNIIVSDDEKYIIFQNGTLQTLTVKTVAGTGVAVAAGAKVWLLCDGTDILKSTDEDPTLLAEFEVTGAPATSIDFSGLDISLHKSYRVEIENVNNVANSFINVFANGDTVAANYSAQDLVSTGATTISQSLGVPRVALAKTISKVASCSISVKQVTGYVTWESYNLAAITELHMYAGRTNATKSNLTQLTFTHTTANGFGIGSKIRIYRGDK